MELSVIIPVYGAVDTLRRCVESLSVGSTDDYEVVLVDDGATDGSGTLCDELAAADDHIRVIHTTNRGPSAARNTGLEQARGELIYFADADDYLEKGTVDQVMQLLRDNTETDIVEFPAMIYFKGSRQWLLPLQTETFINGRDYWLKTQGYTHTYVWNKMYRRKLFSGLRFPEGQIYEDAELMPRLLERARRIETTEKGFYYYCDNPKSLTAQSDGRKLRWLLEAYVRTYVEWGMESEPRATDFYLKMLNAQLDVYPSTGDILLPKPSRSLQPKAVEGVTSRIKLRLVSLLGVTGLCRIYKLKQKVRW